MSRTIDLFTDYLKKTGALKSVTLGGTSRSTTTTTTVSKAENNKAFKTLLDKQITFNNSMVITAIVLLCLIFLIGVFFVFYYRDSPQTIGGIFGGTFFSLLAIIVWLRKLWVEKNFMDMATIVLTDLPPMEAAKFVETIYWNMLKGKN